MASRGGPRALGTDGTDYMHRERVANHYNVSALNKNRVKWTVTFHWAMLFLMLARLSTGILTLAKLDIPVFMKQLNLPQPQLWELAWICSILASMFAYFSLRRNNSALLRQAVFGQVVLGLAPVFYGLYSHYPDLEMYLSAANESTHTYPLIPLTYAWLAICLQVHLFQIYFSSQLLNAWKSPSARKSQ